MKYVQVPCSFCEQNFLKELRRFNESQKNDWKLYCSRNCLTSDRNKQSLLICINQDCGKTFKRTKDQRSINTFCSHSCAASYNNKLHPKRKAKKLHCLLCNKEFSGLEKFCSKECKNKNQTITQEKIITQIKQFYEQQKRIPLKREFSSAFAARKRFGSWNNAIAAAGFNPHLVRFAKKYIANDGHKCDSLAEKIIDDWLYARKIPHERSIPYGKDHMTADFKVNDVWIEFFGLSGELKQYDKSVLRKKKLWKEMSLKVIELYPKDLFPTNKLNEALGIIVSSH